MIPIAIGTEKGNYCDSCNKVVRDFSKLSDGEITDFLLEHRGEKVCGRFHVSQVVPNAQLKFSFSNIPNFLSPIKKFAVAAMIVFGSSLFNITSVKGENITSFRLELDTNSSLKINYTFPFKFNNIEMDSVMSNYDSLLVLLKPELYCEEDEIAELPPLLKNGSYSWDTKTNPLEITFSDTIIFNDSMWTLGWCSIPEAESFPSDPIFDPSLKEALSLPKLRLENSTLTEESKKENEENDKKRDHPKSKTNNDLIDDSDFPSFKRSIKY